jgi:glycosyltransferase involved in cell wall biosynthesis
MGTHKHFLLSSNRWYSAATEYALRVCEHLHGQGHSVRIYSHAESPILAKGKALGMETQLLALRRANGRALGVLGLINLIVTLFRMLSARDDRGGDSRSSKLYIWVLEGHEHALVSLLRTVFSSLRRNSVLVRLRMQDRFDGGGLFGALVARGTDHLVFPSEYARARFFEGRSALAAAYGDKVTVQYFCKDFYTNSVPAMGARQHEIFDLVEKMDNSFTFVAVARFDPIKGLALLIESFVHFSRERIAAGESPDKRIRLVICGRSENIKAESLWQHAAAMLGNQSRKNNVYLASSPSAEVAVFIIDGFVDPLSELLRRSDCAVISSLGSEVICRTAVEFLQMGLPIVSTTVGSLVETIGQDFLGNEESGCGFFAATEDSGRQSVAGALEDALTRAHSVIAAKRSNSDDSDSSLGSLNERCRKRGGEFGLAGFKPLVDRVTAGRMD